MKRGYCSICGGFLTGGQPCKGGEKVDKPVPFEPVHARAIASSFVLSHRHAIEGATAEQINEAIGKIGKVLWELIQMRRKSACEGKV